jgi:hypothetical protein
MNVVGDPQQYRLSALRPEGAARGSSRKLAFDRGDDALNESAPTLEVRWKFLAHPGPYPLNVPPHTAPFGRNEALVMQDVANMLMVTLTVELGIRQH